MSQYTPDRWEIVEFNSEEFGAVQRVLAGWYGGYTGSDSWKLSSGVVEVKDCLDHYEILNHSGSVYVCYKRSKGSSNLMHAMIHSWTEQAKEKDNFQLRILTEDECQGISKKLGNIQ